MYSLSGALGRSMDFVPLHHQFTGIEFYEPNPVQQEANIKMLACFLNQTSLSSCFRFPNCPHLLFLCQNLFPGLDLFLVSFPLDADGGTVLHLSGDGTLLSSVKHTLIHTSQIVPLQCYRTPFCWPFLVITKNWMTLPWTGYSQFDESISCIVCRNRFSTVLLLV